MMNCSDLCRVLDERNGASADTAATAAFRAHVDECDSCAGQALAEAAIAGFRTDVPPLSAALAERARQLGEVLDPPAGRRPTRRPILVGSLLLIGAAASLFSLVPGPDDRATT